MNITRYLVLAKILLYEIDNLNNNIHQMDQLDDSFELGIHDESFHVAPIKTSALVKPNNRIFASDNDRNHNRVANKCLKVLSLNKVSGKFSINEDFQDYLISDDSNPDAVVVSFLGPKKIGKSFLLDCLISSETNTICRLMTKNSKGLINAPSHSSLNRNNEKLVYLDCGGETSQETFLWTYFISSIIVYNLSPSDANQEDALIDHLSFVQSHFDSDIDDLSLPQLILVRRDTDRKEIKDANLLRRIEEFGLVQSEVIIIHLPYPGGKDVKAKQLPDIPQRQFSDKFTNEVEKLLQMIRCGKPKVIRGNYLSCKILSLALEPVTTNLNREHRLSTSKIWDEVIETLSVGFYNFYLQCYSEQLQKEFADEKPCDKYSVYKKLSKIRRLTNKRVEGFKNIADEPIFEKYKMRLEETLQRKEQLVREVNKKKSRDANTQYCQKLLTELNENNCVQLIDEYCKSELDDQKAEVLLEQFEPIFEARSKLVKTDKNASQNLSKDLQNLEKELDSLNNRIRVQSQPKNIPSYDFQAAKSALKTKQQKYEELQAEYDELKNASRIESQNRSESQQLIELEEDINKLNEQINSCEKQIDALRKKRQLKMKEVTVALEQQFQNEQNKVKQLQKKLQQLKENQEKRKKTIIHNPKNKEKSKSCCSVM